MVSYRQDLDALIKAVADSPRRDNTAYHQAMAEAREMFDQAETALGGPVTVRTKTKLKPNGKYVVKWVFERAE
ncbi:hypothetical protein [Aliirhizobium smilacinae]|uniref:Uncharacterized protein n=1 Tax=Aliirhizobium smilacinae TaxID=1395944 RepID=A0A5C4XGL5_9HYPH|nr:hypothetical protein [Rhizobium smilacinae]TNM62663.1 hypothetical protein FHP24_15620 [Rhizobium smilacinae]